MCIRDRPEPDPVKYRKELKEVSYDVLFDRETKTYVPISAIRKYAYENETVSYTHLDVYKRQGYDGLVHLILSDRLFHHGWFDIENLLRQVSV